jgi:hypothetical protein
MSRPDLAPKIVSSSAQYLQLLKAKGLSVLIEQKLTIMANFGPILVMGHGVLCFKNARQSTG